MDGTYDPTKVTLVVHGNTIVGFAKGSFIKVSRNEDAWSLDVGADGRGVRIRNANKSGRFECTLQASSPSNDILAGIAQQDEDNGDQIDVTYLKDASGSAKAHAQNSWVVKHADLERAKEMGEVPWIIETDLLDLTQGGTTPLDS